jgi:Ca2+/Na+ antiporter
MTFALLHIITLLCAIACLFNIGGKRGQWAFLTGALFFFGAFTHIHDERAKLWAISTHFILAFFYFWLCISEDKTEDDDNDNQ